MRKEKGRANDLGHDELKPRTAMVAAHGTHARSDRDAMVEVKWVVA